MKFKFIFIFFNTIILLFLSAVCLLPLIFLGQDYMANFRYALLPLTLILVLALLGFNVFYLVNHRLFTLLEREDWPALVDYLEQRVIHRGRYSRRLVQLLTNSYLVMSDSRGLLNLENKLALARPALLEENALIFGAARILVGDFAGASDFFQARLEKAKVKAKDLQWIRWYYGFSRLLSRDFAKAEAEFKALAAASTDGLIAGLSVYFLNTSLLKYSKNRDECRQIAAEGEKRVKKAIRGISGWKKEAAKVESDVHAAIIRKYIDEAGVRLYGGQGGTN
ncbi:MAG: hypothetical protein LBJ90_01430 [Treponema sp.]|nr:hypothetical protein [Treponema sp.]